MSSDFERGCCPITNSCVIVPQDKWYVVEKFGRYSHNLKPGLTFVGLDCFGCCISFRSITSRVEQNDCQVRTKTRDNVFVTCNIAVQQAVKGDGVGEAVYKLSNVHSQIESYVSDVVRSTVPLMTLDEAFEKKDHVSDAVQKRLSEVMAAYGFQIIKALVTELVPERGVVDSMNEINKQKRLRDAALMVAEAEKIKVVKAAEANAEAMQLAGKGIARQRASIVNGLTNAISQGSGSQVSMDEAGNLLLVTQYFETLQEIAHKSRAQTLLLPHSASAVGDTGAQLKKAALEALGPAQMRM